MDTVNRVVETASKAIWGEQDDTTASNAATASNSHNKGMTGIESVDRVVNAGKKAIWGEQSSTPHGEEPVAGKRGLGTATDPYDAGNRDEQPGAPSEEEGGLPTTTLSPATEQRTLGTTSSSANNMGSGSGVDATPDLKTTAKNLRPDPSQPGNATDSPSRVVADAGPGQTLKHTSEPLEKETQKLANDLNSIKMSDPKSTSAEGAPAAVGATATNKPTTANHSKDDSMSPSSTRSSSGSSNGRGEKGQKTKTSKLEKVKNKLHIGSHSPKASREIK